MRLFIFLSALLLVSACETENPTYMGSGYKYHSEEYHAPPGRPAKNLGYEYSPAINDQQQAMWRSIAADLVDKMQAKNVTPQPVYLETLLRSNAFNSSLDYALREDLRSRGYVLMPEAAGNLHLRYQAYKEGDEKIVARKIYNEDKNIYTKTYDPKKSADFIFTLMMVKSGKPFGEVKTQRKIPAYGYVTGEGIYKVPDRLTKGFMHEN